MNLKLPHPNFREGGSSRNGSMKKELPVVRKCLQQVDPTSIKRLLLIFFIYPFICNFYSYYIGKYNHLYSQPCKINIILCRLVAEKTNCSKL